MYWTEQIEYVSIILLEKKVLLDGVELESRKRIPAFRKLILHLREGMGLETGGTKVCNKNRKKKKSDGSYMIGHWRPNGARAQSHVAY